MAKAYFKCARCGVNVRVEARNRSEADRLAAYRESKHETCSDCWKAEREAENQAALAAAATSGLPTLTGSEKQVAWATKIRQDAMADFDAAHDYMRGRVASYKQSAAAAAETLDAIALLVTEERDQTTASWWIDHRTSLTRDAIAHRVALAMRKRAADLAPTAYAEEQDKLEALRARGAGAQ